MMVNGENRAPSNGPPRSASGQPNFPSSGQHPSEADITELFSPVSEPSNNLPHSSANMIFDDQIRMINPHAPPSSSMNDMPMSPFPPGMHPPTGQMRQPPPMQGPPSGMYMQGQRPMGGMGGPPGMQGQMMSGPPMMHQHGMPMPMGMMSGGGPMTPGGPMGPQGNLIGPPSGPLGPGGHGRVYPANQAMVFNPANPNAPPIYPCGVCHKEIHDNDQAILCESGCNFWFHRTCTGLTDAAYLMLTKEVYAEWACDKCLATRNIPLVKMKS